jgi:hypothetical protein
LVLKQKNPKQREGKQRQPAIMILKLRINMEEQFILSAKPTAQ